MRFLLNELQRRRVLRVAGLYVVGAWLVVQVAGEAADAFAWPPSLLRLVWAGLLLGFPIVLLLGWRYDIVGGRIVRTGPAKEGSAQAFGLQRIDYALGLICLVLVVSIIVGLVRGTLAPASDPPVHAAVAGPALDANTIAILPLRDLSEGAGNDTLVTGLHEDLVTQVAKVGQLRVIASSSLSRIAQDATVRQAAHALNAGKVLEGSVRRSGDQIRVNVKLVDALSERNLWAERYDRELTAGGLFAIQSEIAEAVADAMHATLSPQERSGLQQAPTASLDAYEAYLLGNQALARRTVEAIREALGHFARAIELDPDYALAYVRLADATLLLNRYGGLSLQEAIARTDRFVGKALSLDPNLGAAYTTAGLSLTRQSRPDEARRAYERAIALDPNHAPAFHWYGDLLLTQTPDIAAALPLLERARKLDPLSAVITVTLGETYEALGRFEAAYAQYEKALTFDPDYPGAYWLMAMYARFHDGRPDEGVRLFTQELHLDGSRSPVTLGYAYLDLGDDETAEYWFQRALETHPDDFWTLAAMVDLHRFRGEAAQSLEWARRLDRLSPFNAVSLFAMVTFGEHEAVVASFRERFPESSCDRPQVDRTSVFNALNLSLALERTGELLCAHNLLEATREQLDSIPRLGTRGYGVTDVLIHARLGEAELALAKLREALDAGVRSLWWAHGVPSAHLGELQQSAKFQSIMDELAAELALHRARVREMEASGELPVLRVTER